MGRTRSLVALRERHVHGAGDERLVELALRAVGSTPIE